MKRFDAVASGLVALGLLLTGCEDMAVVQNQLQLNPLDVNGRDGGGKPLDYATLMRIGSAAHAGGDFATAVGVYRRAAEIDAGAPAPFVAIANTLVEMGKINEAIVAYNSALARNPHDAEALRGQARAYLLSGKPQLAGEPLSVAFKATPDDPKLLQLIGVADDFTGQHEEAQARYRRGLELLPRDPGLSVNLALSLAVTGNFAEAIAVLTPIAMTPIGTPRERQTLALIYGLQGDRGQAERLAKLDLDPQSVQRNIAFYDTLRRLSPDARAKAIQSLTANPNNTGRAS
jgi:Flp pilus assembly protein TadD